MAVVECVSKNSALVADSETPPVECTVNENSVHITRYTGKVLETRERNGSEDSDFYAVVWNGEKVTTYEYGTTRFWTYHNSAAVDATPAVLDAANAYARERLYVLARERDADQARQPQKGKTVVVTRGRKVPVGTTGRVFWYGETPSFNPYAGRYGAGKTYRVGVETEDGARVFVAAEYCQVVDPQEWLTPAEELRQRTAGKDWVQYRSTLVAPGYVKV